MSIMPMVIDLLYGVRQGRLETPPPKPFQRT